MANTKLFPSPEPNAPDDKREPHEKFSDLASRVVTVPKKIIDRREQHWKRQREEDRDI
jgi:hypothetical protein